MDTFSHGLVKSKILVQRLKLRKLAKQVDTFSPAQPLLLLRWEAGTRNNLQNLSNCCWKLRGPNLCLGGKLAQEIFCNLSLQLLLLLQFQFKVRKTRKVQNM